MDTTNLNRVLNQTLRHPLHGLLFKYTNVMKGWQYRWFTVDAHTGTLSYYLCDSSLTGDEVTPSAQVLACAPRGQVQLAGAVVCPSDEDSRTFSIGCASGDTVKLRAADARSRQEWVDGLRAVVESHTKAMDISNSSPLPPRELLAASDAMVSARQALYLTEQCNASLARTIENIECETFSPTDPDLLLLKAISTASTQCLHQCLSLLQRHEEIHSTSVESAGAF
ncbi:oxysterol-binding protein-related protein 11-like [Anastrepha obliqua]|uniref:oxysterol-binding protein-related protein 11-like n=1 Tax=Anastrepha obliqua TaxID=95512 RepID=UPI002409260B|nr:oxysterol-binding protein-related protein 11-like [Anastrepha obliqua]